MAYLSDRVKRMVEAVFGKGAKNGLQPDKNSPQRTGGDVALGIPSCNQRRVAG